MDNTDATNFNWSCNHTWKRSAKNTAWCLLGCSIGDFGTILFFQLTKIPFPVLVIMTLAIINGLIKSNDTNFKGVGQPLRIALTGSKFGPGIYDIIMSLGKEEVTKRLTNKIIL